MAERKRIGLREVRALQPGETVWDGAVPGFGARRQTVDAVAYVLNYRTAEGRQRWHTIGRHGAPWTPDTAREEARRLLGEMAKGAIRRPRSRPSARPRRSQSCATPIGPMPRPAAADPAAQPRRSPARCCPTRAGSKSTSSRCWAG